MVVYCLLKIDYTRFNISLSMNRPNCNLALKKTYFSNKMNPLKLQIYFYIFHENMCCAHWNCLNEMLLMSFYNLILSKYKSMVLIWYLFSTYCMWEQTRLRLACTYTHSRIRLLATTINKLTLYLMESKRHLLTLLQTEETLIRHLERAA